MLIIHDPHPVVFVVLGQICIAILLILVSPLSSLRQLPKPRLLFLNIGLQPLKLPMEVLLVDDKTELPSLVLI